MVWRNDCVLNVSHVAVKRVKRITIECWDVLCVQMWLVRISQTFPEVSVNGTGEYKLEITMNARTHAHVKVCVCVCMCIWRQVKTSETVLSSCLQLHKWICKLPMCEYDTKHLLKLSGYDNHLHGLIFELKERMNSRQDRPVMWFNLQCSRL